ncbi:MAG TPA: DNA gyrase inhibitor YacG [Pyrinomonadaceae bacterium]
MKCPTCGKPAEGKDNPYRPFCSERCKLLDFGRWVNEEYRVPEAQLPADRNDVPGPSPEEAGDE